MIRISCYPSEYKEGANPLFTINLTTEKQFDVSSKNEVTHRRIETGYEITDNVFLAPRTINLSGIVGDINIDSDFTFSNLIEIPFLGSIRHTDYIKQLRINLERIRNEKLFLVIYNTKDGKYYRNFLLTQSNIKNNMQSTKGFSYSLNFQEVTIGTVGEVSISTRTQAPYVDGEKGQGGIGDAPPNFGMKSLGASMYDRLLGTQTSDFYRGL